MLDIIDAAHIKYIERQSTESGTNDSDTGYVKLNSNLTITTELSLTEELWDTLHQFQSHLQPYDYQPTDLIYIGFKELIEICQSHDERPKAMLALENARLVFIDEIHPQGNKEQIKIVLHLLERRYELGKAGTFLTTDLTTHKWGGGDEKLRNRLLSCCAEMLVTVDFSDCDDWRLKVKARRVALVEEELDARIHRHPHKPSSTS